MGGSDGEGKREERIRREGGDKDERESKEGWSE